MGTLYIHRENCGEGCGFLTKLQTKDYSLNEDTTVYPVTQAALDKFVNDFQQTNVKDDWARRFFDHDACLSSLWRCVDIRGTVGGMLTAEAKKFIEDADFFFDMNWDDLALEQVREAA